MARIVAGVIPALKARIARTRVKASAGSKVVSPSLFAFGYSNMRRYTICTSATIAEASPICVSQVYDVYFAEQLISFNKLE